METRNTNFMKLNPDAIISIPEAKAQGLTVYRTGNPCKNGHRAFRYTDSRACLDCKRGVPPVKCDIPRQSTAATKMFKYMKDRGLKTIERGDANIAGLSMYYTGKVCSQGHDSPRYVNGGACVECRKNPQPRKPTPADRSAHISRLESYVRRVLTETFKQTPAQADAVIETLRAGK